MNFAKIMMYLLAPFRESTGYQHGAMSFPGKPTKPWLSITSATKLELTLFCHTFGLYCFVVDACCWLYSALDF